MLKLGAVSLQILKLSGIFSMMEDRNKSKQLWSSELLQLSSGMKTLGLWTSTIKSSLNLGPGVVVSMLPLLLLGDTWMNPVSVAYLDR